MRKLFSLMMVLLLAGCAAMEPQTKRDVQRDTGLAIQEIYEQALPTLSEDKQRHFAQRLYRLTGEQRWRPLNRAYGERLLASLEEDIVGLAEPGYAAARSRAIVADYSQSTAKQRARRAMLGEWGRSPSPVRCCSGWSRPNTTACCRPLRITNGRWTTRQRSTGRPS